MYIIIIIMYTRLGVCVCVYEPWVFSDTVAVFIVRRAVGKQIGSVTQVKRDGDAGSLWKKHIHCTYYTRTRARALTPGDSTDCKHSHTPSGAHHGDIN